VLCPGSVGCVRLAGVVIAWNFWLAAHCPAMAQGWAVRVEPVAVEPWREVWAGAEATGQTWSAYTGLTAALGGSIRDDGWRFRSVSGYGRYHYQGYRYVGGHPIALATIEGRSHFADVMLGYQARFDWLTIKAFAGVNLDGHQLSPDDPANAARGIGYGAKAALETWLNLSEQAWVSIDQSYATAHNNFSVRARAGYRLLPELSIGPEAGATGTRETQNGRAGGFLRYEGPWGETSVSAGVSGDIAKPTTPYATVNLMLRY